jgi:EmrB/QacA subfamily drug resistance transporter
MSQLHAPVRHKGAALAVLAITQLMIVLDGSIVNVALPAIQRALEFKPADLQWIVTAYTLMFGGFMLLGGRVADRYGRRKVFLTGLILFVAASAVAGAAQNSEMLILARGVQGLGGALMSPAALSLLTVIFDEGPERNKALGVWGGIAAGGAAIGLLLGGILVQYADWRWIFFVNIPFGVAVIVAAFKFVPESSDPDTKGFDIAGAVTVTAGLMALVYALVRGNEVGWASGQTIGTLVASAALLGIFFWIQETSKHPLMPLRIFRNRNVLGADLSGLFLAGGMFAMFFFISIFIQTPGMLSDTGYSAIKTGLAFLPTSLVIGISAGIGSKLLGKFSPRVLSGVGMAIAALGLALLTRVHPDGSYIFDVLIPLAIMGAGMGVTFVSITAAAVTGVSHSDSGLASALLNTGQQVGGSLGLAILTAVQSYRFNDLGFKSGIGATPEALTSAWAWAFGGAAIMMGLGAIIAYGIINATKEEAAAAMEEGGMIHAG